MRVYVGPAVQSALRHMMDSEYTHALAALRPALDMTAQAYYGARRMSRTNSVRFLDEHSEIIAKVGLNDQSIGSMAIYFPPMDIIRRKQHSFGEIVGYILHGHRRRRPLIWMRYAGLTINGDEQVCTDPMLLSGIIVSIVVCPVNGHERIEDRYWLPSAALQDPINDLWGKSDQIRQRVLDQA